jgi:hypothetical protein
LVIDTVRFGHPLEISHIKEKTDLTGGWLGTPTAGIAVSGNTG